MWRDRLAASLISSKGEGLAEKTPEDRQLREDPSEADPLTELEFSERFIGELDFFAPDYARPGLAHHAWRVRTRNRSMNLTTIVEPEEMARKHAIDSLAARPLLAEGGGRRSSATSSTSAVALATRGWRSPSLALTWRGL